MRVRLIGIAIFVTFAIPAICPGVSLTGVPEAPNRAPGTWQTPARLIRRLGSRRGTIEIRVDGVSFRAAKGPQLNWPLGGIHSFYIAPHKLQIKGYANRGWRLPGEKVYRFDLARPVPPATAAALASAVGKPSRNAVPNPDAPAFASLEARHQQRTGGSNGVLRFSSSGIAYVTKARGDSRRWRWADIQTIASPSAYGFTVGGYLETYNFELKQPLTQKLFDRLWDAVYGRGLQLGAKNRRDEDRPGVPPTGRDGQR